MLDYKKIEDDEYHSKRILTKILKERRTGRKKFIPDEFKKDFLLKSQNNQELNEFQRRFTSDFGNERL